MIVEGNDRYTLQAPCFHCRDRSFHFQYYRQTPQPSSHSHCRARPFRRSRHQMRLRLTAPPSSLLMKVTIVRGRGGSPVNCQHCA